MVQDGEPQRFISGTGLDVMVTNEFYQLMKPPSGWEDIQTAKEHNLRGDI